MKLVTELLLKYFQLNEIFIVEAEMIIEEWEEKRENCLSLGTRGVVYTSIFAAKYKYMLLVM